jgi:CBS domain-containing membrane protein
LTERVSGLTMSRHTSGPGMKFIDPSMLSRDDAARFSFAEHHKVAFGVLCAGFVCIYALASLAMLTKAPLIFPSLGATSFLLLSAWRTAPASPRNVLFSNAIAIVCGYVALRVTGLLDAGPSVVTGVGSERVIAAALALGLTGGLMLVFHTPHAPAGATTLIVALGLVGQPLVPRLIVVEGSVALLVAMAFVLHRCRGRSYPLWRHDDTMDVPVSSR